MDKIIDNILTTIDGHIRESDKELKLFKVMLSIFYIYYGYEHKEINQSNKLYKVSKKDQKIIENELFKYSFLNQKIELYKLGVKFDKLMESDNRVKTGSFYTPEDLAMGIVKLSISDYFKSKDLELHAFFRELDILENYNIEILIKAYSSICKLRVADLSCGTGMFLLSFLNIIIELNLKIRKLDKDLKLDNFNVDNIYGFDIQNKPLSILRLSIEDLLMRYDFLESHKTSIYCLDTLKASKSEILSSKRVEDRLDIIFGNPPYIGEKGNKKLFEDIRKSEFGNKYYEGKMDYFYYFIYRGISLLKKDGVLGYITTNYFVSADGALKLREYLKENCIFLSLVNFNDLILFPSAPGQHNMIFTLKNKTEKNAEITSITVMSRNESKKDYGVLKNIKKYGYDLDINMLFDDNGKILLMKEKSDHEIIQLIIEKSNMKIGDFISVKQGIVSGADKVSKLMLEGKLSKNLIESKAIKKDDPIFVIDSFDDDDLDVESCFIKPFYKNSSINLYFTDKVTDKRIIYLNESIDDFEKKYPKTFNHFIKYKEVLDQRREVKNGSKPWYLLQWGRSEDVFKKRRIVVPQRSNRNKFALASKEFYGSADIYYLYINDYMNIEEDELNYYLLGLLNSKLYYFWLYNMGKRKGNLLELYSKPISQIPIFMDSNSEFYNSITSKVIELFDVKNYSKKTSEIDESILDIQREIDDLIYKEYMISDDKIKKIEEIFSENVNIKSTIN